MENLKIDWSKQHCGVHQATSEQMEMRATYDAFRIMNLVSSHLSNDR